jgi:hypothetical protein
MGEREGQKEDGLNPPILLAGPRTKAIVVQLTASWWPRAEVEEIFRKLVKKS